MEENSSVQTSQSSGKVVFRRNLLLFLLIFLPCVWFFSIGHINQTSRYDAISAIFENTGENAHTFRIDRYLNAEKTGNTTDWSEYDGHYYSNKSPGTTLFGAALLAPVYLLERCICPDGGGIAPSAEIFNAWYVNFLLGVLPVSLSVFPLIGIFTILGVSRVKAEFCALGTILCTGVFPYATTLLAHSTVAACLIFALWLVLLDRRLFDALAGACCGIAVLMDYSAGLILLPAVICLAVTRRKALLPFLLGGIPFAVLYGAYNAMCFGSCFAIAAQYINPIYRENDMLNIPSFRILCELLIGSKRGILLMMPFFLFAFSGFTAMCRRGGIGRHVAILCAISALLLLLLNASFNGWHGGATTVARYMIPAFPAWAILAFHAPLRTRKIRLLFLFAAGLSLFNMFAIAGYTVMTTDPDTSPLYRTTYSHLFDTAPPVTLGTPPGRLAFSPDCVKWLRTGTFTVGTLLGMNYLLSRIVIALLMFAGGIVLICRTRARWAEWLELRSCRFRKPEAFTVLFLVICVLLCIAPRMIPWGVREAVVSFVRPEPEIAAPYSALGVFLGRVFFSALALLTKSAFAMSLLKTILSLTVTCFSMRYVSRRLRANPDSVLLFLIASPYVMLAHRSLDPASLLLPFGALLFALACRYSSHANRYRAYLRPIALIGGFAIIITVLSVSRNVRSCLFMPAMITSWFGFAGFFCGELAKSDPGSYSLFALAGYLSVALSAVCILTGLVIRRGHLPLLIYALAFAGIGPMIFGAHPFSVLICPPVLGYFAAVGMTFYAGLIRKYGSSPIVLQSAKGMFAFYIVFSILVWIIFTGVVEKGNGFSGGAFGTTLAHQSELVNQTRNSMIRRGIPQNDAKFTSAKKDSALLKAYVVLYRMDAEDQPYYLLPEYTAPNTRRPSVLIRRDNDVTGNGTLKVLLSYSGK